MKGNHRLKHLGRSDYRHTRITADGNDPFLSNRHIFETHLERQITTGNHHTVTFLDDVLYIVKRVLTLDLRYYRYRCSAFRQRLFEKSHIRSGLNKGQRQEVQLFFHRKIEIHVVLRRKRWQRNNPVLYVDPLVALQLTASKDF